MNPSLIRLDDESPFTSPTPVGQPLGEPVALTRTAATARSPTATA
ncbi:hypothetical protein Q083_01286 [Pseudomonas aeruginosa M8A.4]|nr:hypothetical protein Q014_05553 [Pseudomonas aeruginosa BWHPSA001]ERX88879.1 hypothetical protein Q083_01286 [Pseudomonas aeruginosa M8A.4]ERY99251.1 hypothetical protein Q022_03132 [Pseudomonas aeruginosa BWHPSA009]WBJ77297.1 hypothetical protein PALA50_03219 [Pseudomonas aeruginosa]